jgi:xanthine/CO dehydrogenase XdhC/CoxF family maturation factor
VSVVGASYRRPGARMLVCHDGHTIGGVSGGGLEADVARKALQAAQEQRPTLLHYDTTDEEEGGAEIEILVEPLSLPRARWHVDCLRAAQTARRPQVVAVRFRGGDPGALTGREAQPLAAAILRTGEKRQSQTVELSLDGTRSALLLDYLKPIPRLLIVGAGPDVEPLAACADALGYEVMVLDERPGPLSGRRLPARVQRAITSLAHFDRWQLDAHTACVVATHDLAYDVRALHHLWSSPAGYIGVVGARQRTRRMIDELADGERLYAPAGLDIGGATPEQLALAILAEIEAVQNQRPGGHLRDRHAVVHVLPVEEQEPQHV